MKVQEGSVLCVAQGWSGGGAQEETTLSVAHGSGEGHSGPVLENSSTFFEFFRILQHPWNHSGFFYIQGIHQNS
jgi:hypothetical protein